MKKILPAILGLLLVLSAQAATFNQFGPVNGVLKGAANTPITTAATSTDITAMWTGCITPSTYVLKADGTCAVLTSVTPAALTRVDDTNVTLTLGGTPSTALLQATSITAGWTGQLSVARGGTGVSSLGNITKSDDTNVTLTLGGTPTGAVVNSTSFTLGWTGTLAASRGGLGMSTVTDDTVAVANGSTWQSKALTDCDAATSAVTYDTTANAFGCNTINGATGANPSASAGLTAVNGSALTFMRSDGAPAISQSITPTWTGRHIFSTAYSSGFGVQINNATPGLEFYDTNATADTAKWALDNTTANNFCTIALADNYASFKNGLCFTRSGLAISSLDFGNATNSPAYNFLGTGTATFDGPILAARSGYNSGTDAGLVIRSAQPNAIFNETSASANNRLWRNVASGGQLYFMTSNDALSSTSNWLLVSRSGSAVSNLAFGNATDNPSYDFLGTGVVRTGGVFQATGNLGSGFLSAAGAEVGLSGGTAYFQAYNRNTSAYIPARISGSSVVLDTGGTARVTVNPGVVVGTATGGDQGAGTVNATGLFINGVPVSGGATTTGSFTGTMTGVSGSVTCTVKYRITGSIVFLYATTSCLGTSNANTSTMTGLPAAVQPARAVSCYTGAFQDNTTSTLAGADIAGGGSTITFSRNFTSGGNLSFGNNQFTSSGTKGPTSTWSCLYDLDS